MHGLLSNWKQYTKFYILTSPNNQSVSLSYHLNQLHVLQSVESDYKSGNKPLKRESSRSTRVKDMQKQQKQTIGLLGSKTIR